MKKFKNHVSVLLIIISCIIVLPQKALAINIDKSCTEEQKKTVQEIVYKLSQTGIDSTTWDNVYICFKNDEGNIKGSISRSNISIKTINKDYWKHIILHELGHEYSKKLGVEQAYNWTKLNKFGSEYLKLKGYSYKLDENSQWNLPWSDRIGEWFANDFAFTFRNIQIYSGEVRYYYAISCPEPDKELENFIEQIN